MNRTLGILSALLLLSFGGGEAASRASFDDLVANLKSPNSKTRQESAQALGKSRRREAVSHLAALVRDPDVKVRLEVVRALRELRDLSAVPALVTTLGDEDPKVREESTSGIVEIYSERERTNAVGRFLEVFSDEFDRASVPPYVGVDPSVYRALGDALRDPEKDVRQSAALALGILGGRGQVPALVTALNDVDAGVRGAAATAIGKVGRPEEGKALIPVLADENASVRKRVLYAIGTLRIREAGPAVRQLYDANRRKESAVKILETLSRIGDPAQADLFRELVQDPDPEKKRLAVEGLGRIADESMLPAFKKDYQRERNEDLRLAYAFAITLLGDRAFLDSIVLSLPSRSLGRRCRDYILEMGPTLLGDLYPYLNDAEADIRAELCDILALMGDAGAIPKLTPLINDPNTNVADRANRAVERLRRTRGSGLGS
jgi:HEAT repeat protein